MKRQLLAIVAVLMIVSLACGLLPSRDKPTPESPASSLDSGSKDKGDSEDGDTSHDGDEDIDSEDGDGDDSQEDDDDGGVSLDSDAFDQLDYYRSTITMRFESGDGSVDESIIESSVIREPSAQHMVMTSGTDEMEMIQIEDKMWLRFGEEWMQTSSEEGTDMAEGFGTFLMDADDIEGLQDTDYEYSGKETVDGVKTRHYRAKYTQAWMMAFQDNADDVEVEDGIVDFWVADERDLPSFVVKMELVMEGTVDDKEAKYVISQHVTDINTPFTIEPPSQEEVGGLPDDVPMYPDAKDVTTLGGMTIFSTEDEMVDVSEFYNDALEAAGWERSEHMEIEGMISDSWKKDGETMQLTITLGDDDAGSSVMIMLGE